MLVDGWLIQTLAPFFYYSTNACFFSFIDHLSLNKQSNTLGLLVAALSHKHWDLGSIPRSPPFSILFCFPYFCAAYLSGTTIQLYLWARHMSQEMNPRANTGSPPCTLVSRSTRVLEKSTKGLNSLGLIADHTSKIGVNTPHWFAYYFLSFHFFYLFVLFILVNSSKLIFIKYKKKTENHKTIKNMLC